MDFHPQVRTVSNTLPKYVTSMTSMTSKDITYKLKPKVVLTSTFHITHVCVVATTHWNGTHSLFTSAKLSVGYLVVGITRELDKEPSLYYPLYIYMAPGLCYNNIYLALKSMPLLHVLLLIHMCFP